MCHLCAVQPLSACVRVRVFHSDVMKAVKHREREVEDMSGRWWQGHHYPKQTSERGSVCERGRNSVCVYALLHASLSDENERSPLQALCASKDTIYEGTVFAQAQLWVHDYVYASVCVRERECVAFNVRNIRKTARNEVRERKAGARVGGNHLQFVSKWTPMALSQRKTDTQDCKLPTRI